MAQPMNDLFWWVLGAVALLALVVAVRLIGKQRGRSRRERALADQGLGRADLSQPAPPRRDSER